MELKKASFKTQQEVALVALTYRTSYKSLAMILGTTIEDIEETFRFLDDLSASLHYLNQETLNEDEIAEEIAFNKTKDYFLKKTKLYKKIKEKSSRGGLWYVNSRNHTLCLFFLCLKL